MDLIMILILSAGLLIGFAYLLSETGTSKLKKGMADNEVLSTDVMQSVFKTFGIVRLVLFLALVALAVLLWRLGYYQAFFALFR